MKKYFLPTFLSAALILLSVTGCNLKPLFATRTFSEMYFGAPVSVQIDTRYLSKVKYEAIFDGAEAIFREIHTLTDPENPESDVAKFNALKKGESVELTPVTADIVKKALDVNVKTNGYFNILIAPLTDLWGFSSEHYDSDDYVFTPPEADAIENVEKLLSVSNITLESRTLTKNNFDEVAIDLGGIAKGYAVTKAREFLSEKGVIYGIISAGSSSLELMKYQENTLFDLGIAHPRAQADTPPLIDIPAADCAVSTSGDYERFYDYEGKRYSHLLDPFSGSPVDDGTMSVTVIGKDGAECDALSTALCAMGWNKAKLYAKNTDKTEMKIFITYSVNGENHVYANVDQNSFRITDDSFILDAN